MNQPIKRPLGRPSTFDGKRVNVYLDAASLQAAAALGSGNVSAGLRKALVMSGAVQPKQAQVQTVAILPFAN